MPPEQIIARGKIFELVQLPQEDGRIFEVARRAPGVRLIIADKNAGTILLSRELRRELNAWDYRLPGGKVFDTLEEFEAHRVSGGDMMQAALSKAKEEALEEVGIEVMDLSLVKKSILGTTVEWDLFVFEATAWQFHERMQSGEGEQIEADTWVSYADAERMIMQGEMQEERVALVLLRWLRSHGA